MSTSVVGENGGRASGKSCHDDVADKRARQSIVFIGAGNVATHLAPAIESAGVGIIRQVYSRTAESASALCSRLSVAEPVSSVDDIMHDADVYVVSLVDDAVAGIVTELSGKVVRSALWLHTSGSLPKEVLEGLSESYGVFYPLQTFSKGAEVDMAEVPIFIEGNTSEVTERIRSMARAVSSAVRYADSELRRRMHIAAVFACNFTNYMFTVADDLLRADGLTLEVLHPLLRETVRKAMAGSPADGQTGPAVRGDRDVMERHISMLPSDLASLYSRISEAIYNRRFRK